MKRVPFLLFLPVLASAHAMPGVGDFYAGMIHPLLALDQLLPLIALCLVAAQCGKTAARRLLIALPVSIVAGVPLASILSAHPRFALLPLAATVALGLMAAAAKPITRFAILPVGMLIGLWIGASNALDSGGGVSLTRFTAGIVLSVLLCSAYLAVAAHKLIAARAPLVVRVAGVGWPPSQS